MSHSPNRLSRFWQELKRRRVVHVIVVYASAAFVLIELVNNVYETLNLPEWTPALTLIILTIGFPPAVIFSWIFDVTPQGIEKTGPVRSETELPSKPSAGSRGWKIATFISATIVVALVVLNIIRSTERSKEINNMEKSIAVLPFENWSYANEFSHLGNAISNEIITELSKIEEFRVISHTSTLQYEERNKAIPVIGEELGVNYIVEGIVERQDDRVNIHVQVIRVKNEDHIWAEEYDGQWKDIFKIQDDIAFNVAEELKAVLSENEIERIEKKPTENMVAYNFYLRANDFFWKSFSESDYSIAINMYNKAIELDPEFALAYCMLARSNLQMYWLHHDRNPDLITESKKAIDRAFSLEPDLIDAHVAFGYYYYHGFLDYENALRHFQIALDSNPDNAEYLYNIALVNRRKGDWERAIEGLVNAVEKEPGSTMYAFVAAQAYRIVGEYTEALRYIDLASNLAPDFTSTYGEKISIYLKSEGDTKNARMTLEEASLVVNSQTGTPFLYDRVILDICDGNYQHALGLMTNADIEAFSSQFIYYPKSLYMAFVHNLMGSTEQADDYYNLSLDLTRSRLADLPDDSRLFSALGISYAGLGQKDRAVQAGKRAVELMPVSKEAFRGVYRLCDLAWIYVMAEEYDQALEILDTLLSMPGILSVNLIQLDPRWKPLWDHPDFVRLTEKHAKG